MTQPQCPQTDMDCPEPNNYAAIAKQLHETALQAEDRIFCLEQTLRGAVNMPAFIETSTSAAGTAVASGVSTPLNGTGAAATTFQNSTFGSASILPEGVYHVGQFFNGTPTGAATINTFRIAAIDMREVVNGVNVDTQHYEQITWETATGNGGDMTVTGIVRSNGRQRPIFSWIHGNTGSTVQINIGAIRWIIRISDSSTLRVV